VRLGKRPGESSTVHIFHSFSSLSYDRSKASSKASSPHSAKYTYTHKQYTERHKTNNKYNNTEIRKNVGRAPSLRVLPWHLPYNWVKCAKLSWNNNIKMYVKEMGWQNVDWIHLAPARDKWRTFVNTVIDFGVHKLWGISWLADELWAFQAGLRRTELVL
jgi:hypothetical protein